MEKTIILYGMRGTGKSTVGKKLSEELGYDFVDLDRYIEEKNIDIENGVSHLPDYIDSVGWDEFRDEEFRCAKEVLNENNIRGRVISLGGGTIAFDRNRRVLFEDKNSKIIYLDTELDEIARRISKDEASGDIRNSLTGKTILDELEEIYLERKEIYENNCDFSVDNNGDLEKTISEICYKLTWGGICVPITDLEGVFEIYEELLIERKIEYVELRLDIIFTQENTLSIENKKILKDLIEKCPKKIICTLRNQNEGGEYIGTESEQARVLSHCLEYGAEYVDMELVNYSVLDDESRGNLDKKKLILSHHNFTQTPDLLVLQNVLSGMKKYLPAVYKIACMPITEEDVENILELQSYFNEKYLDKNHSRDSVIISMGELGKKTRYLNPQSGGLLNFASYGESSSAPGQIDYRQLHKNIYG